MGPFDFRSLKALGLIGSLFSGIFGSNAASNAASTQSNAAKYAADLQAKEAQNALNFEEGVWNTTQANQAPWLSAGKGALSNLQALLAEPGQGWNETFAAPTAAEAAAYPGYQFQEQQGEEAIKNMFAAKGDAGGGNEGEALTKYAENSAQSDYTNVYNQAFNEYLQRYGQYNSQLNRLSALAGTGQTAATTLGSEGQAAANTTANIDLTSGAQQGQDIQNAAAAQASGYIGSANAWNSALSGGSNSIMNLLMLHQLFGGGGGGLALAG